MSVQEPYIIEGKSFISKTVNLDNRHFAECQFRTCTLVYAGGVPPMLRGCSFEDCQWQFADHAANTLAFLSGFYSGGFSDLVENTFHNVRKGMFKEIVAQSRSQNRKETGYDCILPLHPIARRVPKIVKIPKTTDKDS